MAAALLSMVCELTAGKKRFAAVQDQVERLLAHVVELRDRAMELIDEDMRAYSQLARAMKLPRESEDERIARRERVQDALKDAAKPPLEIMRVSLSVLEAAEELVVAGNPALVSDVGVAALAARSAFHAARLNVEINRASVHDGEWVAATAGILGGFRDADQLERTIMAAVQRVMHGETP